MATPSRSLADDIRGRSDAELIDLVLARPDLARPAPADLTSLAARAGTRASVQRAVEALDRGHLQVLEAVVVAGDAADRSVLLHLLGTDDATTVDAIVQDLWRSALLWRGADGDHVVRTVPEVLGTAVAGPGRADARAAAVVAARARRPRPHPGDHRRGPRRLARHARADDVGAGLRRAAGRHARTHDRALAARAPPARPRVDRPRRAAPRGRARAAGGPPAPVDRADPARHRGPHRLPRRRRRRWCRERVPDPRRRARRGLGRRPAPRAARRRPVGP